MSIPCTLRPATAEDFPAIRELIHQVGINPTGLNWQRFVVAIGAQGGLIGCGQIKPHGDSSIELASIAVVAEQRGQGIARRIIEHLLASQQGRLYLTCRESLGPFYERFGFRTAQPEEMTPYFRRLSRLSRAILALHIMNEGMLVMIRP
jgi:N-acetylglutamate synthase-like GNAT family acetyltransferase